MPGPDTCGLDPARLHPAGLDSTSLDPDGLASAGPDRPAPEAASTGRLARFLAGAALPAAIPALAAAVLALGGAPEARAQYPMASPGVMWWGQPPRNPTPPEIPPYERGFINAQIANAMEFAPANAPRTIPIPSGASMTIRASEPYAGPGPQGRCRTFSYQYRGSTGLHMTVRGERCRLPSDDWVAPGADTAFISPPPPPPPPAPPMMVVPPPVVGAPMPPPVVVPAPPRVAAAPPRTAPAPKPSKPPPSAAVPAPIPTVILPLPRPGDEPPPEQVAAQPTTPDTQPPAPAPAPAELPAPTVQPEPPPQEDVQAPPISQENDPQVISMLSNLRYLDSGTTPTPDQVKSAIGTFESDEGITQPLSLNALQSRLMLAQGRLLKFAPCAAPIGTGEETIFGVCVSNN